MYCYQSEIVHWQAMSAVVFENYIKLMKSFSKAPGRIQLRTSDLM